MKFLKLIVILSVFPSLVLAANLNVKPKGFVDIKSIAPEIIVEARYFDSHNFVGTKIDGYHFKCPTLSSMPEGYIFSVLYLDINYVLWLKSI